MPVARSPAQAGYRRFPEGVPALPAHTIPIGGDREPPLEAKAEGHMIACHFPEGG